MTPEQIPNLGIANGLLEQITQLTRQQAEELLEKYYPNQPKPWFPSQDDIEFEKIIEKTRPRRRKDR